MVVAKPCCKCPTKNVERVREKWICIAVLKSMYPTATTYHSAPLNLPPAMIEVKQKLSIVNGTKGQKFRRVRKIRRLHTSNRSCAGSRENQSSTKTGMVRTRGK